jgi:hypothetical protein
MMQANRRLFACSLAILLLCGCKEPDGQIKLEALQGRWIEDLAIEAPVPAHAGRIVAYRMTYQLCQKTGQGRYVDITDSTYRGRLRSQSSQNEAIVTRRIFHLWGPGRHVLSVLEQASSVLRNESFSDLSDSLWVPDPMADILLLPAVRRIGSEQLKDVSGQPMFRLRLEVAVQARRGHYDKWVKIVASACRMRPDPGGHRWQMVPAEAREVVALQEALEKHLDPEFSSVLVSPAEPMPEAIPARSPEALDGQSIFRVPTPAGAMLCIPDKQRRSYQAPALGQVQVLTHESFSEGTAFLHRTLIDELAVVDAMGDEGAKAGAPTRVTSSAAAPEKNVP